MNDIVCRPVRADPATAAPCAEGTAALRGARPARRPGPRIVLDISRLLSRAGREAPTGIDRVELAYAQHLIAEHAALSFAAFDAFGRIGLLPHDAALAYVAALAAAWRGDGAPSGHDRRLKRLALRLRAGLLLRGGRGAAGAAARRDPAPRSTCWCRITGSRQRGRSPG